MTSVLTQNLISVPVLAASLCCLIRGCHDISRVSADGESEKLIRRVMTVVSSIIGLPTRGWSGSLIMAYLTKISRIAKFAGTGGP